MKKPELPFDLASLLRNPDTDEHYLPMQQPGYYPGYSTLAQQKFWDAATRELVLNRVADPPPIRFLTAEQAEFWRVVFDHLIPQTDRTPDRQIPLIPALDKRLFDDRTVGYRFEDMPHDREIYTHYGVQGINLEANAHYGRDFLQLSWLEQDLVLRTIHDGQPRAADIVWKKMSVHRFWQFLMEDAINVYYAHPWAWDEIGYGGPAYPRAYTRLERGEAEPWEVEEQRYAWDAPRIAVSDEVHDASHHHLESDQHRHTPARTK